MDFLENKFFLLALTFAFFFGAKELQKKTGFILLNPILVTIALLIVFLQFTDISYETYEESGYLIEFWLKPAVVALGVPLYLATRNDQETASAHHRVAIGRLSGRNRFGRLGCQTFRSHARSYYIAGLQVGNDPYCHGGNTGCRGYPLTHSGCGGMCRYIRRDFRIQSIVDRTREKSHCARIVYGYGFTCRRYFGGDGGQRKVRGVCRIGIDAQRYLHRPFYPYDFTNVGVDLTSFYQKAHSSFVRNRNDLKKTYSESH